MYMNCERSSSPLFELFIKKNENSILQAEVRVRTNLLALKLGNFIGAIDG